MHDANAIHLIPRQMFVNEDVRVKQRVYNKYTSQSHGLFITYKYIAYNMSVCFLQFDNNFTLPGIWLDSDDGGEYTEEHKKRKWKHIAEVELDMVRKQPHKPPKPVPSWMDDNDDVNIRFTIMRTFSLQCRSRICREDTSNSTCNTVPLNCVCRDCYRRAQRTILNQYNKWGAT